MKREHWIWIFLLIIGGVWLTYRTVQYGVGVQYVHVINDRWVVAGAEEIQDKTASFSMPRTIGTWVAAFFTLAIFSFLYRDNLFYKLAEATLVGVSAAYVMVVVFWSTMVPLLFGKLFPDIVQVWAEPGLPRMREDYWFLFFVPLALGIMLLWRLAPRGAWISRWPLAFTIGVFAGLRLVSYIHADFVNQISNSILPLFAFDQNGDLLIGNSIKHAILIASLLACLVYFFFSFEHKGMVGAISRVGIWVLMITFGAGFGYTVMGRFALLAIRFEFLFYDWLKLG